MDAHAQAQKVTSLVLMMDPALWQYNKFNPFSLIIFLKKKIDPCQIKGISYFSPKRHFLIVFNPERMECFLPSPLKKDKRGLLLKTFQFDP
jgi:hypothetical protein